MKEWYSPAELAELKLPGMPKTRAAISALADMQNWRKPELEYPYNMQGVWRKRQGKGGGFEYRSDVLPLYARTRLILINTKIKLKGSKETRKMPAEISNEEIEARWAWFDKLPDRKKDKAKECLEILNALRELEIAGTGRTKARQMIALQKKIEVRTIFLWEKKVVGLPRPHWLPFLAPRHTGKTVVSECSQEAFDAFCTDYLRNEAPNLTDCYRRLKKLAKHYDWTIPSESSLRRKLDREVDHATQVYMREGKEALKRLFPAQHRDKTCLHAMQAVNADTHIWDVWVTLPDGTAVRPAMIAFQDIYSGKFLSWRITRVECREVMLLAIHDMVDAYGVPEDIVLDNSGTFKSTWIIGRTTFRFGKIRNNEPIGVLVDLGMNVHFTQPYSGQSKPIERGFRDFAQTIAKHPSFAGAWTGNTIEDKPDNWKSKSVPFEEFERIVTEQIIEHNERIGRRSDVCKANGWSFDQAFEDSYAKDTTLVKKATEAQKRMCLMGSEGLKVQKDSKIRFMDNVYWDDELTNHIGRPVIIRFDPEDLYAGLSAYHLDGSFICQCECTEKTGFFDTEAGRNHNRARRIYTNAKKKIAEALKGNWTIEAYAEALAAQGSPLPPKLPEKKTVRMVANGGFVNSSNAFDDGLLAGAEMLERGEIIPFRKEKSGS